MPLSINDNGTITGYAVPADGNTHGFVRASGGNVITFDAPGSKATVPQAINIEGTTTGYFFGDNRNIQHGFVRYPNGLITTFDPPDSRVTTPTSINALGTIAGFYSTATGTHGFLRGPGGKITSFDTPVSSGQIRVTGINVNGETTGWYSTISTGRNVGFVRNSDGHFTSFDPGFLTEPTGINDQGDVTGQAGTNPPLEGFFRLSNGLSTVFHVPGCVSSSTRALSINDLGVVTGWCAVVYGQNVPGFVRFP
jgi:hypothetical protein